MSILLSLAALNVAGRNVGEGRHYRHDVK